MMTHTQNKLNKFSVKHPHQAAVDWIVQTLNTQSLALWEVSSFSGPMHTAKVNHLPGILTGYQILLARGEVARSARGVHCAISVYTKDYQIHPFISIQIKKYLVVLILSVKRAVPDFLTGDGVAPRKVNRRPKQRRHR